MAASPDHGKLDEALQGIHRGYQGSFANAAARTSATSFPGQAAFTALDVGKFARQTDNNTIWMLTATTPTWVSIDRSELSARVTKSAVQALTTATTTVLTFDTETWDGGALHDNVTNNSRLTAPIAGKYLVEGTVRFAANSTGKRLVLISTNGATNYAAQEQNAVPAPDESHVSVSALVTLAAAEYAELSASQNSGGNLNVETALTHFSMVYVGP